MSFCRIYSILTLLAAIAFCGQATDSLPAKVRLVSPKPFTVITQNSIRLLAEAPAGAPPMQEIRFFATYKENADSLKALIRNERLRFFGAVKHAPYELIADLSGIPDQDLGGITFFIRVVDSLGREWNNQPPKPALFALDRNPRVSDKVFHSRYLEQAPALDGVLDEWRNSTDTLSFLNGENRVRAVSGWDKRALYFAIEVFDNSITGPYRKRGYLHDNLDPFHYAIDSAKYVSLIRYDEIEVFFNIKADRSHSVRTIDDRHLLIGAKGAWYGRAFDHQAGISKMWGTSAQVTVREYQNPPRYVIEAALPWAEFGLSPKTGLRMAFDLFNKDNRVESGPSIGISWNGAEYTNYNNPSEWGELLLTGGPSRALPLVVAGVILAGLGIVLYFRRQRRVDALPAKTSKNTLIVNAIETQILANFSDPDLNAEKIARAIGINPKYAGSLFKAYKNTTLSQYLNNLRLQKARELLEKSDKNVTEIAFEVGYGAPEYFAKVFKSAEGVSPSEYRLKIRSRV